MSLIDGKDLVYWEGCSFDPLNDLSMDLLARCMAVDDIFAEAGEDITWTEAGRPYGQEVPDYSAGRIPPNGDASKTASGISTVWFQAGRQSAGYTPEAANPRLGPDASRHTVGDAVDASVDTVYALQLRDSAFARVGMTQTIKKEPWHRQITGPSSIDLQPYRVRIDRLVRPNQYATKPVDPFDEENDMYVWTNLGTGKSYSVSPGIAQHHVDGLKKAVALKSIGGASREIQLEDGELAFALESMGLGMFVDSDYHLSKFSDPVWNGRTFYAPYQDGGVFFAEFRSHYGI